MKKIFTFGSSLADLNAFERNLNANGEVYIGETLDLDVFGEEYEYLVGDIFQ